MVASSNYLLQQAAMWFIISCECGLLTGRITSVLPAELRVVGDELKNLPFSTTFRKKSNWLSRKPLWTYQINQITVTGGKLKSERGRDAVSQPSLASMVRSPHRKARWKWLVEWLGQWLIFLLSFGCFFSLTASADFWTYLIKWYSISISAALWRSSFKTCLPLKT